MPNLEISQKQPLNWDRVGVFASTVCIIHCALIPVVISLAPSVAHLLPASESVHRILVFVLAAIGGLAFRSGFRIHRRKIVLAIMLFALVAIATGALVGEEGATHLVEIGITTTGSVLLICAHVLNRTFCRHCRQCNDGPGEVGNRTVG